MIILSAKGVTKRFSGLVAVNEFDFEIEEHSITSIIGPNGAGKTTFFNCITGFYTPEEGEILFNDYPIQDMSPDNVTRMGISRTYQNIRLFPAMTAIENILVGMHPRLHTSWVSSIFRTRAHKAEEAAAMDEANRLLRFVGLQGVGDQLARNLPYGSQRRLEIARAIGNNPTLLLLDEPTTGMNPQETAEMTQFIRHLRDELRITILLIEHDMRVVMGISETISVLDFGTKIAEGSPEDIQNNQRVIEAYLGRGAAAANEEPAPPPAA